MKSSKNLAAWLPLIIAVCMAAGIWIGLYVNRTYRLSDGEKKFSHVLELIKDEDRKSVV